MSRLTDLFKQYELSTVKRTVSGDPSDRGYYYQREEKDLWGGRRLALTTAYGDKVKVDNRYASLKCNEQCTHFMQVHQDEPKDAPPVLMIGYNWAGQGYLVSKAPIPADALHEINTLKDKELEAARKRRHEVVKTPRDVVRMTFKELGIETTAVTGNQRVDCGPFEIEFKASKDNDPKVDIVFVYRAYYVQEIKVATLSIADPDFAKKVDAIVFNGKNLNKLILGEVQPKKV